MFDLVVHLEPRVITPLRYSPPRVPTPLEPSQLRAPTPLPERSAPRPAATAAAAAIPQTECAWVVWQRTDVKGAKTEWDAIDALRSVESCHEVAQRESARLFQGLQSRKEIRGAALADVSYDGLAIHVRFVDGLEGSLSNVCLPETVDPRPR
jgi:hypothetical protein